MVYLQLKINSIRNAGYNGKKQILQWKNFFYTRLQKPKHFDVYFLKPFFFHSFSFGPIQF